MGLERSCGLRSACPECATQTTLTYGGPCLAGGGEAEPTAAASAAAADTTDGIDEEADESNSKMPKSGQGGNDNDDDGDNTLWEQMTAREGRDAARRAGMSVGDWQAERQLQEALRESVQVSSSVAPAIGFFVAYCYNHWLLPLLTKSSSTFCSGC